MLQGEISHCDILLVVLLFSVSCVLSDSPSRRRERAAPPRSETLMRPESTFFDVATSDGW